MVYSDAGGVPDRRRAEPRGVLCASAGISVRPAVGPSVPGLRHASPVGPPIRSMVSHALPATAAEPRIQATPRDAHGNRVFAVKPVTIWTIGHSTRTLEELLALLREHGVELLADVRHFPSSKQVPWTNRPVLASSLEAHRIRYRHFEDLGGYRKPRPDSPNTGWRSTGFRGYADHMATEAFSRALDDLLAEAAGNRTAVMCAEAVPWRCHRSLLADALQAREATVVHILGAGRAETHRRTTFAKVRGGRVTHPGPKGKGLKRPHR